MLDKVQLIKEEIERRIGLLNKVCNNKECETTIAYKDILKFIDSLPEESESKDRINECPHWEKYWGCETSPMNNCNSCPQAKWVEVKEEKENYDERYKRIAQTEQFKKSYCDKSLGKEEPASNDLEGEITKCYKSRNDLMMTRKQFGELIHHFANWQKQQMKEALQTEYEKGKFDMREEMMKDAVEGEVRKGYVGNQIVVSSKDRSAKYVAFDASYADAFCVGDKVKIIIVKTEQQ